MSNQLSPDTFGDIAFRPREVKDSVTPLIREQNARNAAGMQAYGQSLNQNNQARVNDVQRQKDAATQYGKDVEKLTQFSQSLTDMFKQQVQANNEKQMQEGIAMAYEQGVTPYEAAELEATEQQVKATDQVSQPAGTAAFEQTGSYEMASKVKNLSGWRQYGYQQGRAQMAGAEYGSYIENAMNTDNTTQITVNGETFTPATARGAAQVQAAMAHVRGQFIRDAGLTGTPVAMLNKYAFPQMHRQDAAMRGKFRDRFAADESFAEQTEAKAMFQSDKDLGSFITRMAGTLGSDGKALGNRGAHAYVSKYLEESIASGTIDVDEARSMKGQVVPWDKKGRTFGELYPNLIEGSIKSALRVDRAEAAEVQREKERAQKEQERELVQEIAENPGKYSEDDLAELQREYTKEYGVKSLAIEQASKAYSSTSEQKRDQREMLLKLQQIGQLRPHHLVDVHPEIAAQFTGIAQQQQQAAGATGTYKDQLAAIKRTVSSARGESTGDGAITIPTQMVVQDLQSVFLKEVAALTAAGDPMAVQNALKKTEDYFVAEGGTAEGAQANPKGKYAKYQDAERGPVDNFFDNVNKGASSDTFTKKITDIEAAIKANSPNFGTAMELQGLVLSKTEAEGLDKGYGTAAWKIPPMVKYLAQKYNQDPFAIINAQREAWDLKPLESLSAMVVDGMTASGKALIHQFKSENRATRAISSQIGQFNADIIPYGAEIQEVSQQFGADPAHIAALAQIESQFDPNAVSPTGAVGLMQIQPDQHPTFTGGMDPLANLAYGAQYYQQLLQQFGDPVQAAGAYNAGPGRFQEYLETGRPLPAETVEHMKKFTKALTKYNRQALNAPTSRRGTFEVAQIVSNDPRYKNDDDPTTLYDPEGHGGDDMHQHYEFTTKKMAQMAKALYEKQGFRVTSYMRPHDDGSAHQHGYAIDVAPPLDLPRNDEAEMEWIDKANAVIGLNT